MMIYCQNRTNTLHLLLIATVTTMLALTACNNSSRNKQEKSIPGNSRSRKVTKQSPTATAAQQNKKEIRNRSKEITAKRGHRIAAANGCFSCHSINGNRMAGPSFKNLYGKKVKLKNGNTVTADSAYIVESIKKPKAKLLKDLLPLCHNLPIYKTIKLHQLLLILNQSVNKMLSTE